MTYDVDFYLKRGFDRRTAEYFVAGRKRAKAVRPQPDKTLLITFDNDEVKIYDMRPAVKEGGVFAFLTDQKAFERAYVDENGDIAWDRDPAVDSARVWSNKVDISADTCYLDGTTA